MYIDVNSKQRTQTLKPLADMKQTEIKSPKEHCCAGICSTTPLQVNQYLSVSFLYQNVVKCHMRAWILQLEHAQGTFLNGSIVGEYGRNPNCHKRGRDKQAELNFSHNIILQNNLLQLWNALSHFVIPCALSKYTYFNC